MQDRVRAPEGTVSNPIFPGDTMTNPMHTAPTLPAGPPPSWDTPAAAAGSEAAWHSSNPFMQVGLYAAFLLHDALLLHTTTDLYTLCAVCS